MGVALWLSRPTQRRLPRRRECFRAERASSWNFPLRLARKRGRPLYHSGTIRYFSTGIGQVEREAAYPPFALKLVFTAGGKSFVTGVE